jgi:death-on-curing protein
LQAAALAHGIAESQPFIEGNKRTALTALRAFLLANGCQVTASQAERFRWMLRLSEGETVEELAANIRTSLVPVRD